MKHDSAHTDSKVDVPCDGCGYDLRGTPHAERCPECGASVEEQNNHIHRAARATLEAQRNLFVLSAVVFWLMVISLFAWRLSETTALIVSMAAVGLWGLSALGSMCLVVIVVFGSTNTRERNLIYAGGYWRMFGLAVVLLMLTPGVFVAVSMLAEAFGWRTISRL
jgi:hypothetical protein